MREERNALMGRWATLESPWRLPIGPIPIYVMRSKPDADSRLTLESRTLIPVPNLVEVQTRSYARFLQEAAAAEEPQECRLGSALPRDVPDQELRRQAFAGLHLLRTRPSALLARKTAGGCG